MRQYDAARAFEQKTVACAAEHLIRISADINSWVYDLYNKKIVNLKS